jgi:hypothetical protein
VIGGREPDSVLRFGPGVKDPTSTTRIASCFHRAMALDYIHCYYRAAHRVESILTVTLKTATVTIADPLQDFHLYARNVSPTTLTSSSMARSTLRSGMQAPAPAPESQSSSRP